MLKALIFDVDGTLVDSVDAHAKAWTEALEQSRIPCDFAKVRHQIGKGGDELLKEFLPEEEIERQGERLGELRKEIFQKNYLPGVKGFPKVRELFQRLLDDKKQVVLASSAMGEELATYKERAGITDLVQDETSKDDAEKSKPHPDIFLAALEKLEGIQAGEVFVIGDSPWDAIAAERAGIQTIGLLSGGFSEAELMEAGCVVVYDDPADLLEQYDVSPLVEPKV